MWKVSRCRSLSLVAFMVTDAAVAYGQTVIQLAEGHSPPLDDIIVEARPGPTGQEVERQARAITPSLDVYRAPLARFHDPVCPGIMGLPVDAATLMVDRIRLNAERVGARVDRGVPCKPNIIVVFIPDGRSKVRGLLKERGYLIAGLENADARRIEREPGPAWAWSVTALRTRFGEPEIAGMQAGGAVISGGTSLGPVRVTKVPGSDSKIFLASQNDIVASVVIIDLAAIIGMSVVQIADYASMRALARTQPVSGKSSATTILSLFNPLDERTQEITSFDLAYLRSLYKGGANLPAAVKIAGAVREYRKLEAAGQSPSTPK
jgi:hypothetical protein